MKENIEPIYRSLEEAIAASLGHEARITEKARISGGDINDAYRIVLSTGETLFVKTNSIKNLGFFTAEAMGLQTLKAAGEIGVPGILGIGIDEGKGFSFLLLEYIDSAPRIKTYWETFGRQLAELHRAKCPQLTSCHTRTEESPAEKPSPDANHELQNVRYGFFEDNFIGASPQKNLPKASWIDFYRECRLLPQIKIAEPYLNREMCRKFDLLLEHLGSYLREPEFPSLLHGDLWSGNVLCGNDGKAWILDPASYIGDHETDLAMTQLFGSFPAAFYDAYHEINPIDAGYADRRDLYHLYHLLNHLNLFGRAYLSDVTRILNRYV